MKLTELNDLAYAILEGNEGALISGSLALKNLGLEIPRDPKDIDILIPHGHVFQKLNGMEEDVYDTDDDYDAEYYERFAYKINGVKVDVFRPIDLEGTLNLSDIEGGNYLARHLIIGFKVHHALNNCDSSQKHRDDIAFILSRN